MKLDFKNSLNNINTSRFKEHRLKQNKEYRDKNNVTGPAQALSFSGSAVSLSEKFVESKGLNKLISFVSDNEAAYTAIYSLLIAGILKPIFVLNMPGSDEKDKQIVATKNFLQAFIGSFLSLTIGGGIIKKAVDTIKTNLKLIKAEKQVVTENNKPIEKIILNVVDEGSEQAKKVAKNIYKNSSEEEIAAHAKQLVKKANNHLHIFKKNPKFVAKLLDGEVVNKDTTVTLMDAFESFWKNSTGWITAIGKAKISSLLLPSVMAALFAKRNIENAKKQKISESTLNSSRAFQDEKAKFSAVFESKKEKMPLNFKGNAVSVVSEGLAKGVEKMAMSGFGEGAVTKLASLPKVLNKPSARMGDIESFMLTGYWLINTSKSKKIEPDQKLGLNVHTVLVTLVSSIAAFLIDTSLDGFIKKAENAYSDVIKNAVKNISDKNNIKQTTQELAQSCQKLINPNQIVKTLVNENKGLLEGEQLKEAITNLTSSYGKQLSKFKSLTVFTAVVRFLVPVLMVPVSGKLKSKISQMKNKKNAGEKPKEVSKS